MAVTTVTTTAQADAGEYLFKIVSGTVESSEAKLTVGKIEYPQKAKTFNVKSNTAVTGATIELPTILGASYGTPTIKTNGDGLISGLPTVAGTILTMDITSKEDGKTDTLEFLLQMQPIILTLQ